MGKLTNLNPPATITDADIPGSIARDAEVSAAIAAHSSASNPHTQYALRSEFYSYGNIGTAAPVSAAFNFMGGGTTSAERAQNGAFFAFHRPGIAANYFGLATDNTLRFGGWTDVGANWRIWHEAYGTPVWQAPSDSRLKQNIRPIPSALPLLLECKPVSFRYNRTIREKKDFFGNSYQRDKIHYGFLANDVPLQDLVFENDGYLGLDYLEMIPFIVRAMQEQQEQIKILEARLEMIPKDFALT
jgi:hypothetical protein